MILFMNASANRVESREQPPASEPIVCRSQQIRKNNDHQIAAADSRADSLHKLTPELGVALLGFRSNSLL